MFIEPASYLAPSNADWHHVSELILQGLDQSCPGGLLLHPPALGPKHPPLPHESLLTDALLTTPPNPWRLQNASDLVGGSFLKPFLLGPQGQPVLLDLT